MSKSDWLLAALNVLTLMMAAVGLAAQHTDPMSAALTLTILTVAVDGVVLFRRAGQRERAPEAVPKRLSEVDTDLDARRILDIDARLDALERAEDRRLQMLAVEGIVTGPAAAPSADSEPRTVRRNGIH